MPRTVTLEYILQNFVPGSFDQPWSWDDEERDIRSRLCGCCVVIEDDVHVGVEGHYQEKFEAYVAEHGIPGEILLGDDGRVWDGHHRIVAARRLGISELLVED